MHLEREFVCMATVAIKWFYIATSENEKQNQSSTKT